MSTEEKPKVKTRDRQRGARGHTQPSAPPATTEAPRPIDEAAWHERAAFSIAIGYTADAAGESEWQARAYHEESDQRIVLPDISGSTLVRWMRERAGLPAEAAHEEAPVATTAQARAEQQADDLQLAITEMLVDEVFEEQEVGGLGLTSRLRAQIHFQLSGMAAYSTTANQSHYDLQILACDLSTGQTSVLASGRQQLRPESLAYMPALEFEVPPLGQYQLIGTILLADGDAIASALGPLLRVQP